MKNTIIIFIYLLAFTANAQTKKSEKDSVEFLPAIRVCCIINKQALKHAENNACSLMRMCGGSSNCGGWRYRSFFENAGTRNLNYIINFAAKNASMGFDAPQINGARADGNALFINGIRMENNTSIILIP
ncbi:MAG: hypothetical protein SGJ10_09135 [Bacteroidota bacterium]|nr:hypothetical protein [Bacteroidota bacterium]